MRKVLSRRGFQQSEPETPVFQQNMTSTPRPDSALAFRFFLADTVPCLRLRIDLALLAFSHEAIVHLRRSLLVHAQSAAASSISGGQHPQAA